MRRKLIPSLVLTLLAFPAGAHEPEDGWSNPAFSPDPARRFDFWIGEWDVNLRIFQEDLTWKDSVAAEAKVYPILDGKALLELWDSPTIQGYSLRYYDPEREKWVLWLNWPGENRSGSSSLEGGFRHGRGDFFSRRTDLKGQEISSRYSFNDIGPDTLRWDDAYSRDEGRTWTHNWIMEFSRTGDEPRWPEGETAHTFDSGQRCDRPEFRIYEFLAGPWQGEMRATGPGAEGLPPTPARWRSYRILGGCALISLREFPSETGSLKEFAHLTYNTYASRYELTTLDSVPGSVAQVLYGSAEGDSLEFLHRPAPDEEPDYKLVLRRREDGTVFQDFYRPGEEPGSWERLAELSLRR